MVAQDQNSKNHAAQMQSLFGSKYQPVTEIYESPLPTSFAPLHNLTLARAGGLDYLSWIKYQFTSQGEAQFNYRYFSEIDSAINCSNVIETVENIGKEASVKRIGELIVLGQNLGDVTSEDMETLRRIGYAHDLKGSSAWPSEELKIKIYNNATQSRYKYDLSGNKIYSAREMFSGEIIVIGKDGAAYLAKLENNIMTFEVIPNGTTVKNVGLALLNDEDSSRHPRDRNGNKDEVGYFPDKFKNYGWMRGRVRYAHQIGAYFDMAYTDVTPRMLDFIYDSVIGTNGPNREKENMVTPDPLQNPQQYEIDYFTGGSYMPKIYDLLVNKDENGELHIWEYDLTKENAEWEKINNEALSGEGKGMYLRYVLTQKKDAPRNIRELLSIK